MEFILNSISGVQSTAGIFLLLIMLLGVFIGIPIMVYKEYKRKRSYINYLQSKLKDKEIQFLKMEDFGD